MFDRDRWVEIFEALSKNKVRTVLAAFGVTWGMIMLIIMMGAGQGLQNGIMSEFRNSATNSLYLWTQATSMPYKGFKRGRRFNLEFEDKDALETQVDGLALVCPRNQLGGYRGSNNVIRGMNTGAFTVYGDIPEIIKIDKKPISMGRFLNSQDQAGSRKVCVIGDRVRQVLFEKGEDPLGESIEINGVFFKVIGVFQTNRKGEDSDEDSQSIFIPISTFGRAFNYGNRVGWFAMMAADGQSIIALKDDIYRVLNDRHSVHPEDMRAFGSWNMEEEYNEIQSVFAGIKGLSLFVGIFSLLAGAIGISNIMLVVVKERTKEIGIRRALGASPWNVKFQIILESVVLTSIAGIIGIICGVWLLEVVDKNFGNQPEFLHPSVTFGLVFSCFLFLILIGVIAGLLPASRATSVSPVNALHSE
ncbi:MAG: ABC transporter permease [Schleiferiaceae bacterium]|jgi:putative ABC transport system permease protein|nr:ABC transporter permease [Schleiferiaceae bacterium]